MAERPAANAGYSPVLHVRMIYDTFIFNINDLMGGVVKVFLGFVSKV